MSTQNKPFILLTCVFLVCVVLGFSVLVAAYSYITDRRIAMNVAGMLYADFIKMNECHQKLLTGKLAMCRVNDQLGTHVVQFSLMYPDEFVNFTFIALEAEIKSPNTSFERVAHYLNIIARYDARYEQHIA